MARLLVWPSGNNPLTFIRGMDSFSAPNLLPFGAHQYLQNVDISSRGAIAKRYGYAAYGGALGTTKDLGVHELVRNDATTYLLRIGDDGKLYKKNGDSWTNIPIRIAVPYGVTAVNGSSGAVGANLVGATLYQYAVAAVLGGNSTIDSTTIDSVSGQVTTGATPYPITVTARGVYVGAGSVAYSVWRRTYSGSWGLWGRMTTGLTHVTASGETTVTYTDDGNTAPNTGQALPASNATVYTLPTDQRADWVTSRMSGNNAAFFINGGGLCWTDGTNATLIQPDTTDPDGVALTDNRLWDVTDAVYTCRGIHSHHTHGFVCDAPSFPQRFFFSDAEDNWEWFPQNGFINDSFALGGRVLDFRTKDDALVVGTTTGIDVLWGRIFDVVSLLDAETVYFSRVSDQGVASEWSMSNGPGGSIIYLDEEGAIRELLAISPVREQVVEREVPGGESIRPTLAAMTDRANATAHFDGEQYQLAFPADKQVVRIYFFQQGRGRLDAPVLDVMQNGVEGWLKLKDGTLIASDTTNGQLWEMYKDGILTDNGTAIDMLARTASLGLGADIYLKDIETAFVILDIGDGYDLDVNVFVGNAQAPTATITTTVTGPDVYAVAEASLTGGEYDELVYARTTVKVVALDVGQEGHFTTLELQNDDATERPIIYGLYFEFTPERRPSGEDE